MTSTIASPISNPNPCTVYVGFQGTLTYQGSSQTSSAGTCTNTITITSTVGQAPPPSAATLLGDCYAFATANGTAIWFSVQQGIALLVAFLGLFLIFKKSVSLLFDR